LCTVKHLGKLLKIFNQFLNVLLDNQ
jgi:hypothetical protein